jgi:hypothetical protein
MISQQFADTHAAWVSFSLGLGGKRQDGHFPRR